MSIGLEEGARRAGCNLKVPLAIDFDESVLAIFKSNMPNAVTRTGDVSELFDGDLGSRLTMREKNVAESVGGIDILLGGPPCQGHSDLNNHTRRHDPKNALYERMARAAEVLYPKVVVIENVPPVQWDRSGVVATTQEALMRAGYQVAGQVLDLRRMGVPQRRRRYILLASRTSALDPASIITELASGVPQHSDRTVRWAIYDLLNSQSSSVYDTSGNVSKENARRMAFLFAKDLYDLPNSQRPECHRDGNHSYVSVYGRLRWDEPAQTITTGFGSMGQGRYVHPARPRTITPHEAARLQTFPDWFDFGRDVSRGALAKAIGNAVPPLLMVELGYRIAMALRQTATKCL